MELCDLVASYRNNLKDGGVLHAIARIGVLGDIKELGCMRCMPGPGWYWFPEIGFKEWYLDGGAWWVDNPLYPEHNALVRRVRVPRAATRHLIPVLRKARELILATSRAEHLRRLDFYISGEDYWPGTYLD